MENFSKKEVVDYIKELSYSERNSIFEELEYDIIDYAENELNMIHESDAEDVIDFSKYIHKDDIDDYIDENYENYNLYYDNLYDMEKAALLKNIYDTLSLDQIQKLIGYENGKGLEIWENLKKKL
jgi:hypothetical protein